MDGESSSAADRAIDPTPVLSQPFLTASLRDLIPVPPPNSNLPQKRSLHFDTVDDSFPSLAPPSSRVSFARKALKRWFQKAHGAEDDVHVQDGYVFIDANSEIPLPSNFVSVLKPHQVEGVSFIWKQTIKMDGCILAHTMGLGKTLQTIVFLATLIREINNGNPHIPKHLISKRILLLSPLTTLAHWVNELERWIPYDSPYSVGHVYNYNDNASSYASTQQRISYLKRWYNGGGIMLMSYEAFRSLVDRDDAQITTCLVDPGPAVLIADEGHRIKNEEARISLLLSRLKTPTRVCLTGSPLQNHLTELYCLLKFVSPSLSDSIVDFRKEYMVPIENVYADSPASTRYMAKRLLYQLQLLTSQVINRQGSAILKNDLPPKTEYYILCRLTDLQLHLYKTLIVKLKALKMNNAFGAMFLLRMICNHPSLLVTALEKREEEQRQRIKSILDKMDEDIDFLHESDIALEDGLANIVGALKEHFYSEIPEDSDNPKYSNKLQIALKIIRECKMAGDKVILVSHSIITLDYLEKLLQKLGYSVSRIDGNTPSGERQPTIDIFNTNRSKDILLLSSRAGSLGVNITGANRMILYDTSWNPWHEEQSIGRVYRYGQTRPVVIYRLACHDTGEHRLLTQSLQKIAITSRVVDNFRMQLRERDEIRRSFFTMPSNEAEKQDIDFTIQDPVMEETADEYHNVLVDMWHGDAVTQQETVIEGELTKQDLVSARKYVRAVWEVAAQTRAAMTRHLLVNSGSLYI